jgi:hypothetical protein
MKRTIDGFITATPIRYGKGKGGFDVSFSTYKPSAEYSPDTVVVREHSFEVDVDDKFDPRPGLVANLEEQKRLARAEFAKKVKEIDEQIQSLLAIENGSAA